MSMMEPSQNRRTWSIDKWAALGMMKKADEVQKIAEMLEASMEDLFDQIELLIANMEVLSDTGEMIQERMEEIADILHGEMCPDPSLPPITDDSSNSLPY